MSLISVSNLTFYYDGSYDNIFENVSFQIDSNWKLGFIARNGRGKTTFLNLLQKKYEYKGTISASIDFDYFPFPVNNREKDTIEIIEKLYPDYEFWKICRELTLLEVDSEVLYRSFQTLSNGEQTKVMLALLFSKENNFLLIDEPTNHLDMPTRELVMEYLKSKKEFILVSHDKKFLDGCIDHVLVINKTNIEVQQGNFSTWWENKQRQDAYELAENEKLKHNIKRLEESARQAAKWADNVEATKIGAKSEKYEKCIDTRAFVGEKTRRMEQKRKNLENRKQKEIEDKSKLLKNLEKTEVVKLFPMQYHKIRLITMEDISIAYDKRVILEHFQMQINQGERVVLQGKNGCGKSSIIKEILQSGRILCNNRAESQAQLTGHMELASGLIISYVPQDTAHLKGTLTEYASQHHIDETIFKTLLRKLDFSRIQLEKNIEEYSGGQKKKVLLAGSLCEKAHLYIWDEPLNYIDIFSRMQIEELILQFQPTLLMVEHDKSFVEKIATKIIEL